MELRKVGIWMVVFGAIAQGAGLMADAIQHADDTTLAQREGIFDLSNLAHAAFFAGICVAVLGAVIVVLAPQLNLLYAAGHDITVTRRLAQVGAPVAAIALIAGCAAAAGNSKLAQGTGAQSATNGDVATATASGGHNHAQVTGDTSAAATSAGGHDHGNVIVGTATGNSPCEKASPTPASPGQVGAGQAGSGGDAVAGEHGARGMVLQDPLSQTDRVTLEQQMEEARAVAAKFPTVKDAEAGGYVKSTPYVPCIGAHYTNVRLAAGFDPTTPSELLYDGVQPGSKIVGLSYLVFHPGGAPAGFAGPNDHWHQHNANGGLCLKGTLVVAGEESTPQQCEALGGRKTLLTDIWMLHAWIVPGFECSWGVFSGECPELGGRLGGSAWDS